MSNLIKLKMEAFSDAACMQSLNKSINAFINPDSYSLSYAVNYEASKEKQNNAGTQIFTGMGPTGLELELTLDGTGIVPLPAGYSNIEDYIKALKGIVYDCIRAPTTGPTIARYSLEQSSVHVGVCASFNSQVFPATFSRTARLSARRSS